MKGKVNPRSISQVTPKSGKKKKEKAAVGEGTPKSSKKRKDKSEKAASGDKSSTPKGGKADNNAPVNEKSSIKTLISNIPVKRKIKPVPVSDPSNGEEEVEIIKEVANAKVEGSKIEVNKAKVEVTKAKVEVTKAKVEVTKVNDEVTKDTGEKAPSSIKSFFSTIPVKRKAAVTSPPGESQNGGLAKQTRGEANKEGEEKTETGGKDEVTTTEKRDDQKES